MIENVFAMKPIIRAGTTILIPSGPVGDHLFIAIFDIKEIGGIQKVLLVPVVTQFPKCEMTCPLTRGDHPFIKHESIIAFNHCRIEQLEHIVNCLESGLYRIKYPPVSDSLLLRIQCSYTKSNRVPKYIKREWV